MACYHLLSAWQTSDGTVYFDDSSKRDFIRKLEIPCGQCFGCRLERSRQWALRCLHESTLHEENAFITLTYDDNHVPYRSQLVYSDFQKFMKRLRWRFRPAKIGFYMGGEYGPENGRPHFHACLFNCDFPDKEPLKWLDSGSRLYSSSILAELWPFGFTSTGDVTFESAAYIARYCLQKVTGDLAKIHYARSDEAGVYSLVPEFNHMSLKPAIGRAFLEKWRSDVYPHDVVILNGKEVRPPKYYDKQLKRLDPALYQDVCVRREADAWERREDNTPERLVVKEQVAKARVANLRRSLDGSVESLLDS